MNDIAAALYLYLALSDEPLELRLTNHHTMKIHGASGGIAPRILNLGTRWR
jgi:hypothetical protein